MPFPCWSISGEISCVWWAENARIWWTNSATTKYRVAIRYLAVSSFYFIDPYARVLVSEFQRFYENRRPHVRLGPGHQCSPGWSDHPVYQIPRGRFWKRKNSRENIGIRYLWSTALKRQRPSDYNRVQKLLRQAVCCAPASYNKWFLSPSPLRNVVKTILRWEVI